MKKITFIVILLSFVGIHSITCQATTLVQNISSYSFEKIKKMFKQAPGSMLHITIALRTCDPDLIRSSLVIKNYTQQLCSLLGIQPYYDPHIHLTGCEQNEGFSFSQFNDLGIITGKFINKSNNALITILSSKLFNPSHTVAFSQEYFKASAADFSTQISS